MPLSRAAVGAAAAVLVLVLAGCGYDEAAHRADAARALQVDTVDDQTWERVRGLADDQCSDDSVTFALSVGMTLDGDDPERGIELRRVNVEHVCPERLGEFEEALEDLGYGG